MKQLTLRAILLGLVLAAILGAANAYLGLMVGLTVSASIPAAVLSMALLRVLGNSNPRENNIVQTAASAGEALAAGAIFTLPALVLLGAWQGFDYGWTLALTAAGGLLGVLFVIPLRRVLVLDSRLPFPEGTATATVLEAGHDSADNRGVKTLLLGAVVGALIKFAQTGLGLWTVIIETAARLGQGVIYIGGNVSPALLGVGYIVGLNISLLVLAGGVISWWLAIPLYGLVMGSPEGDPAKAAWSIWNSQIRFLGVGAMAVGGLWTLLSLAGRIKDALASLTDTQADDLPRPLLLGLLALVSVAISVIYSGSIGSVAAGVPLALLMLLAAFLFAAVAGYMAGVVGSSHNPVSGMTIGTILLASLLVLLMQASGLAVGAPAALMVGAVVCCAAAIAGDTLQDLKAGALLGATPSRQQIAQILGVLAAALVMAPVLQLLYQAYGFGAGGELPAPQAVLMASVAKGVIEGGLPWPMVAIGAVLGAAIIAFDLYLRRQGSEWRAPVLAVAVGIYLPLEMAVPLAFGGLVAWSVHGTIGSVAAKASQSRKADGGLLLAAGLITGEALMGIALAVPLGLFGNNPFALGVAPLASLGLLVAAAVLWLLRRQAQVA
jgi:putative OPT family oligopeptide transporter